MARTLGSQGVRVHLLHPIEQYACLGIQATLVIIVISCQVAAAAVLVLAKCEHAFNALLSLGLLPACRKHVCMPSFQQACSTEGPP